jgi:hypothetical protein
MAARLVRNLAMLTAAAAAYVKIVRPWQLRWGATDEEVQRMMPGDEVVQQPLSASTRAVTIAARPDEIWPWLLQIGTGRAGWYSYDWIERLMGLDVASARRVIPEYQELHVGDVIPLAPELGITVEALEPQKLLLLAGRGPTQQATLAFQLSPLDEAHTRLVVRVRYGWALTPQGAMWAVVTDPGSYVMMRKMLLGIKERAEGLARQHAEQPNGPTVDAAAAPVGTR